MLDEHPKYGNLIKGMGRRRGAGEMSAFAAEPIAHPRHANDSGTNMSGKCHSQDFNDGPEAAASI